MDYKLKLLISFFVSFSFTGLSQTKYSEKIWLQYVTNGLLLNKNLLDCLNKFEQVVIRVSIDAPFKAGEFFRFPLNWDVYKRKLHLLD